VQTKDNIETRIEAIQAIGEIKNLKYKYFNACDSKKPADILKCFESNRVHIDFEDFGVFSQQKIWWRNTKFIHVNLTSLNSILVKIQLLRYYQAVRH